MAKNILVFIYEGHYSPDIRVWANNEVDLREYLLSRGFSDIRFSDLETSYGTCSFKEMYGINVGKCFYISSV